MYFKKEINSAGMYEDADGIRYAITEVRRIRTNKGINIDHLKFESIHEAMNAWGLRFVASADSII